MLVILGLLILAGILGLVWLSLSWNAARQVARLLAEEPESARPGCESPASRESSVRVSAR
jgi:hypothetical protein